MQVTETLNEGLKRTFKVVVEAGEIDSKVNNRLAEIAPTLNLPGFRPGKVPPSLLKKRYGRSLLGEVLEQAVNETSQQALDERGYRPATQPQIEITQFDEGQDLEYDLSVELMPEIAPMDFSALSLVRPKAEPSDKDIDDALERMAGEQKRSEPIKGKRKSKKGDVLVLDFTGYIDGEAFEGGSAEGQQLELGSNTFIPGFEDQLVGAKAGEAVTVEVTFPDDYPRADYAGKLATFECQVTEIREPVAVEIDDEFAKNFGLEDLAALREAIGQQIGQEFSNAGRLKAKQRLLEKLADNHDFELPEGMVEAEYAEICRQVRGQQAPQEAGKETGPTSEAEADAGPDAG
ncbi:MAG: trigger factor, partial [Pseudomonadota bacterium]|nr:trigger factor [Pseudomonadota bacterium]